ncbi:TPA: site-specific DNA-methyltransferase, partial [Haemophilus influenzae]
LYTKLTRKRQEIFFNQTLAFDEIDRLFDAKAFSKFSRYTADGKQAVGKIKRHFDGTPAENLIIKGNNLIALHSLAKQFKGKIKLIYIDPPYNTGNDGFKYNDKFNHSTWLTFMKNRLEIARELLKDDSVVFVQCDDNEQAYLKVLMDEIFGRDNFIGSFIWKKKSGGGNDSKFIVTEHETIMAFAKDIQNLSEWHELHDEKYLKRYKESDEMGRYFWDTFARPGLKNPINYSITAPDGSNINGDWIWSQNRFLEEKGRKTRSLVLEKGNSSVGTAETTELFGSRIFATPKPEILLQHLVYISTNENDIVLDFFAGSGTTAAVAMKMNRQFIAIEQMDYIETITKERLKKVIDGEQGGISKAVNWQGGGEFVYTELAPFNETAKQQILSCENSDDIKTLFNELYERYFLKYNVSVDEFSQMINEPEFQALPLDEQKQMVLEMLDLNQMYVSLSEMDDEQFADCLNDDDKALSRAFYQSVKNQAEKKDGE